MRLSAIWMTYSFTPPLSWTIGESPEILQTLHSYKLFLQLEKCKFKQREVDSLGLVISKDHVAMDPVKVQGVMDWPQPMKVKDVQSFIGFVNFYQRFIRNFSEITQCHGMTSLPP